MIYNSIKKFDESLLNKRYPKYVLGIDLGGTNTNIAVAGVEDNKPFLLFTFNYTTKRLESCEIAINEVLTYSKEKYDIEITCCCIGAAGIVSPDNKNAYLTNIQWDIKVDDIIENTALQNVFIVNDFQLIGYGFNLINHENKKDILIIKKGEYSEELNQVKAIIGAGTGFGKSVLIYDNNYEAYIPIASEGGHSDFPIYNDQEKKLSDFIKKKNDISQPLTYEELLAGRGIENIYYFLREKNQKNKSEIDKEIDQSDDKASLISKYKNSDKLCKETFQMYIEYYARCAKNFALDTMAIGGLYIGGGIVVKNVELFSNPDFIKYFENAYRREELLKKIPIYLILNYDISLLGACFSATYFMQNR